MAILEYNLVNMIEIRYHAYDFEKVHGTLLVRKGLSNWNFVDISKFVEIIQKIVKNYHRVSYFFINFPHLYPTDKKKPPGYFKNSPPPDNPPG